MRRDAGIDTTAEDDPTQYDSTFEYDSDNSDVTAGWNSQDDSLSSDEGMRATDRQKYQQLNNARQSCRSKLPPPSTLSERAGPHRWR